MKKYTKHIEVTKNRPDVDLANKIKAMFEGDPYIEMEYIDATEKDEAILKFKVSNSKKAAAIKKILPSRYGEGFTSLPLNIVVEDVTNINAETIVDAFKGNPHFKDYIEITDPLTGETYHICIFKKEVLQFKNDNAGSLHGYEFALMEQLAKDWLNVPKLIYTTDDEMPIDEK